MGELHNKEFWSFQDFLNYTGFSKSTGYKITHEKKIPFYKPLNGKILFRKDDVLNFLAKNRIASNDEIEREAIKLQTA